MCRWIQPRVNDVAAINSFQCTWQYILLRILQLSLYIWTFRIARRDHRISWIVWFNILPTLSSLINGLQKSGSLPNMIGSHWRWLLLMISVLRRCVCLLLANVKNVLTAWKHESWTWLYFSKLKSCRCMMALYCICNWYLKWSNSLSRLHLVSKKINRKKTVTSWFFILDIVHNYLLQEVLWSGVFVRSFICLFVMLVVVLLKCLIFMIFGTDIQHLICTVAGPDSLLASTAPTVWSPFPLPTLPL